MVCFLLGVLPIALVLSLAVVHATRQLNKKLDELAHKTPYWGV